MSGFGAGKPAGPRPPPGHYFCLSLGPSPAPRSWPGRWGARPVSLLATHPRPVRSSLYPTAALSARHSPCAGSGAGRPPRVPWEHSRPFKVASWVGAASLFPSSSRPGPEGGLHLAPGCSPWVLSPPERQLPEAEEGRGGAPRMGRGKHRPCQQDQGATSWGWEGSQRAEGRSGAGEDQAWGHASQPHAGWVWPQDGIVPGHTSSGTVPLLDWPRTLQRVLLSPPPTLLRGEVVALGSAEKWDGDSGSCRSWHCGHPP